MAFGVYQELVGDVGMLSNDAFIKAIAFVTGKEYGNVKKFYKKTFKRAEKAILL